MKKFFFYDKNTGRAVDNSKYAVTSSGKVISIENNVVQYAPNISFTIRECTVVKEFLD